jgi:steroid delta-isomerase-like uncharacterized protein
MKKIIIAVILSLSLSTFARADDLADQRTAERVFLEKMGQGRFDRLSEIYGAGFVAHGPTADYTLDEDNASGREWRKAIPDLKVTVARSVSRAGMVAVHWRASGSNSVAAAGLPGRGGKIDIDGMTFFRFEAGRIVEEWSVIDLATAMRQLGGR